ncbi:hypothetical protein HAX54_020636 [Datura stramonium]|uniref:Uncharacterized protein n=1 Tax=Datura stramonium TaxID=4076 RepID=A0ABS8S2T2_DATST|nr:hypothetical protein [Datura stramonium]
MVRTRMPSLLPVRIRPHVQIRSPPTQTNNNIINEEKNDTSSVRRRLGAGAGGGNAGDVFHARDEDSKKEMNPRIFEFLASMKNTCKLKRPEVQVEVAVAQGKEKGPIIVEEAKKHDVALLARPEERSMTWRLIMISRRSGGCRWQQQRRWRPGKRTRNNLVTTQIDILGKKRKGEQRRITEARSSAIEKRKKTLLKEYEQSAKSSRSLTSVLERNDEGLGEFDKAILRSFSERQVKLKKNKYNLSDEDEEDFEIGASLGRDDFDDEVPFDEDDEYYGRDEKHQLGAISSIKYLAYQKKRSAPPKLSATGGDKINALKALVNRNVSVGNVKKDETPEEIQVGGERTAGIVGGKNVRREWLFLMMESDEDGNASDDNSKLRVRRTMAEDEGSDDGEDEGSDDGEDEGSGRCGDEEQGKTQTITTGSKVFTWVLLQYAFTPGTKQSQKFCPEAIVFLQTLLMAALEKEQIPSEIYSSNVEMNSLDFLELMDLPEDSQYFHSDNYRASMLLTILETLQGFVNSNESYCLFPVETYSSGGSSTSAAMSRVEIKIQIERAEKKKLKKRDKRGSYGCCAELGRRTMILCPREWKMQNVGSIQRIDFERKNHASCYSMLFLILFLQLFSTAPGKITCGNVASTSKRVVEDKILAGTPAKPPYKCLAYWGPCSTKYRDQNCCKRQCFNDYNDLHPVAICQEIPGVAVRL